MYYVYVLKSLKNGQHYIGHTDHLERRLEEHNRGKNNSVKNKGPFELIYKEVYADRLTAIRREREIKRYKGGNAFKKLLDNYKIENCDPIV